MKRFVQIISHKWFISLMIIMLISGLIGFWGSSIGIGNPAVYPLYSFKLRCILVVLLFFGWLLAVMIDYFYAQIRSSKIKKELLGAESEQIGLQVQQIQERMEESISGVENLCGKNALSKLPWYMVMGSSGGGKTMFLANSGLNFPNETLDSKGLNSQSACRLGGTLNCKLWLSDDAVLLDTAGRYVQQQSAPAADKAEWHAFLKILRKNRKQQPVNGIIAVVSIDNFLQNPEQQLQHIRQEAALLRKRIEEVYADFDMQVPIYLVFSKCDLIAGFNEFYEDRNTENKRAEIWGVNFNASELKRSALSTISTENLKALLVRLRQRALVNLQNNRLDNRIQIQAFPQRFSQMMDPISEFIRLAFSGEEFRKPLQLRGFYFTSALQEGMPVDQLIASVGETFGFTEVSGQENRMSSKSYFIRDLFFKKILGEQAVAGISNRWLIFLQWRYWSVVGGSLIASFLLLVGWFISFNANQNFLSTAQAALIKVDAAQVEMIENDRVDIEEILSRLDALRSLFLLAEETDLEKSNSMRLGLYAVPQTLDAAKKNYEQGLKDLLRPLLVSWLFDYLKIENLGLHEKYQMIKILMGLNPSGYDDTIKKQLLSEQVKEENDRALKAWFSEFILMSDLTSEQTDLLEFHIESLQRLDRSSEAYDVEALNAYRQQLAAMPTSDLALQLLISDVGSNYQSVRLSDVQNPLAFNRCFSHPTTINDTYFEVPGLYTKPALLSLLDEGELDTFVEKFYKNYWVVYDKKPKKRMKNALIDDTEKQYVQGYIHLWDKVLEKVQVNTFSEVQQGLAIIESCVRPPSPLVDLLRGVKKHTHFLSPEEQNTAVADAGKKMLLQKTKLNKVTSRLKSKGKKQALTPKQEITQHFAQLNQVVNSDIRTGVIADVMQKITRLKTELETSRDLESTAILGAAEGLKEIALLQAPPMNQWLSTLGEGTSTLVQSEMLSEKGASIKNDWNNKLLPVCENAIAGRYPFDRNSMADIPLTTFGEIFGPGKNIDQFFSRHLSKLVERRGSSINWRADSQDIAQHFPSSFLRSMQNAQKIKSAFFPNPMTILLFPLDLSVSDRAFSFKIDGQTLSYEHGPTDREEVQISISWPSTEKSSVEIDFTTIDGKPGPRRRYRGPWALFRALDNAKVVLDEGCYKAGSYKAGSSQTCSNQMQVIFQDGQHRATLGMIVNAAINPYSPAITTALNRFNCKRIESI